MFKHTKRLLSDIRFWCHSAKSAAVKTPSGSVSKTKNGVILWPDSAITPPSNAIVLSGKGCMRKKERRSINLRF